MAEASGDGEAGTERPLSHTGGQAGQGADTLGHERRRQGSGKAVPTHGNEGVVSGKVENIPEEHVTLASLLSQT